MTDPIKAGDWPLPELPVPFTVQSNGANYKTQRFLYSEDQMAVYARMAVYAELERRRLAVEHVARQAIPFGWARTVVTPNTPMGPAEYDIEFSDGDDKPSHGKKWFPLYTTPPVTQPEAAREEAAYQRGRVDEQASEAGQQSMQAAHLLRRLERYIDSIICYASTCDEYEGNQLAKEVSEWAALDRALTSGGKL